MNADAPPPDHRADSGTIELRIRELNRLFSSMDPAPFYERELDSDAEEYILHGAEDLPQTVTPVLVIYLGEPVPMAGTEEMVRNAVQTHFAHRAEGDRRRLRRFFRRGRISLLIGLSFLAATFASAELIAVRVEQGALARVLRESVLIGGWVAMWRPLETFLYDWWPIRGEQRALERLSWMDVRVVCTQILGSETNVQ